jgi:hypothetical protein
MANCRHVPAHRLTSAGDIQCGRCGMIYLIGLGGCRWADRPKKAER